MSDNASNNIEHLIHELLENESVDIRRNAATELGKIKSHISIKPLIKALGDHEDVAIFSTLALVSIGNDSVPFLRESLNSINEQIRGYSAEILGELKAIEALDDLIRLIEKDDSIWVKNSAIEALGRLKHQRTVDILKGLLFEADSNIAVTAALSLHRSGMNHGINIPDMLLNKLISETELEQGVTAWALVEICDKSSLDLLHEKFEATDNRKLREVFNEVIKGINLK